MLMLLKSCIVWLLFEISPLLISTLFVRKNSCRTSSLIFFCAPKKLGSVLTRTWLVTGIFGKTLALRMDSTSLQFEFGLQAINGLDLQRISTGKHPKANQLAP